MLGQKLIWPLQHVHISTWSGCVRQGRVSLHRVDVVVGLIIKVRDGNKVEVAQVAGGDIVPAAPRGTHSCTEQHIHNASPAVV